MKMPKFSFPLYVVKRPGMGFVKTWGIRVAAVLSAFLLAALVSTIVKPGSFGTFIVGMFEGNFSDTSYIFTLLGCVSTYLLLSIAVAPVFKMKFWNIGGEGQATVGAIVTAVMLLKLPSTIPDGLAIVLSLITAVAAGVVWALIPTIFKIKFNTNETLFTLMMNYIATLALSGFAIDLCSPTGSHTFPLIPEGRTIIEIGQIQYLPFVVAAVVLTVVIFLYLKKTKHGFELSVLGDSVNTARYTGIKINKVIIRTMIISGAIAGLVGFLIVCGQSQTLTAAPIEGKGFTAVLIAWLGHFNPAEIALYSFFVGFFDKGTSYVASLIQVSTDYFAGLIIGLFILLVVSSEFFVRYQIKVRHKEVTVKPNDKKPIEKSKTKKEAK